MPAGTRSIKIGKSVSKVPACELDIDVAFPVLDESGEQERDEDGDLRTHIRSVHLIGLPRKDVFIDNVSGDNLEAMSGLLAEKCREEFAEAFGHMDVDQVRELSEFLAEVYTSTPTRGRRR